MAKKPRERNRLVVLSFLSAAVCAGFILLLMSYQIVQGAYFQSQMNQLTSSKLPIKAARGEIVDSTGLPLAANKAGLNIVFYYSFLPKATQNAIIAELITLCEKNGEEWYDPLPITLGSGTTDFLPDQEREVANLKKKLELNVYATAEDCMYYMENSVFKIEGYNKEMTRKIAGVRYGMVVSDFSVNNNQYVFAEDVDPETAIKLKEISYRFPGVDVAENDIRIYPHGETAPHIVGTIGAMNAEEYKQTYKDLGYKMNTEVGKFGIEKSMESALHGVDGTKSVEQNKKGDIISEEVTSPPQSGSKVVLTLHAEFQHRVQQALAEYMDYLKSLNDPKKGSNVSAGAISVLDPKTGAVLAMVTYPSYDINNYFSGYSGLLADEGKPMINRATDGLYRPGSTFKTAVAVAALEEGIISPTDTVNCTRVYRYYDILPNNTFRPTCLGYHGKINVVDALTKSCNIFFYDVGRRLGIDKINEYAQKLGLATPAGLEISSAVGALSGPARSEELGGIWTQGNVAQASIGQMDTAVSPLQLSIQAMTLANRGTRYQPHIIKEIRSYDDKTVLQTTPTTVLSEIALSDSSYEAIVEGMVGVSKSIRNSTYSLTDLDYPVALKTGSPQVTDTKVNAAVVSFAPADDPEIAIGILLEEGQNASWLIRPILDAYYDTIGKE